jgi:FixJ family two-component response regulator
MSANQILVVDDEVGIRELLFEILRDEGYGVRLAENAQTARSARKEMRPDLVLLDIWMPDTDGITLLKEWAGSGLLTMPVVMMSGHGTIDSAVEATRIGAFDFLEKPISLPKLLATVGKALAGGRILPKTGLALVNLGRGRVIQELRQRLEQVNRLRTPVLLVGEPGCGFEVCARHLHLPNTPWVAPEDTEWARYESVRAAQRGSRGHAVPGRDRPPRQGRAEGSRASARQAREIQRAADLRCHRSAASARRGRSLSTPTFTTRCRASPSAFRRSRTTRKTFRTSRPPCSRNWSTRTRYRCARLQSARST